MVLFLYIFCSLFCAHMVMQPAAQLTIKETMEKRLNQAKPSTSTQPALPEKNISKNSTFLLPLRGDHTALAGYCYNKQSFTYAGQAAQSFVVLQRKKGSSQLKEGDVPFEGFHVIVFPHLTSEKLDTLSQEYMIKKETSEHEKECPKSGSLSITHAALMGAGLLFIADKAPNLIPEMLRVAPRMVCTTAVGILYMVCKEQLGNWKHDTMIASQCSSIAQLGAQLRFNKHIPPNMKSMFLTGQRARIAAYIHNTIISSGVHSDVMPFLLTKSHRPEWYSDERGHDVDSPLTEGVRDLLFKKCNLSEAAGSDNSAPLILIRNLDCASELTTKTMLTDLASKKVIVEESHLVEEAARADSNLIVDGVSTVEFADIMVKTLPRKIMRSNEGSDACIEAWESVVQQCKKYTAQDVPCCVITDDIAQPNLVARVKTQWGSPIKSKDYNAPSGWKEVSPLFHWEMPDESTVATLRSPFYTQVAPSRELAWNKSLDSVVPRQINPLYFSQFTQKASGRNQFPLKEHQERSLLPAR